MTGKQPHRKPRPGVDECGRTPLHYAALENDLARLRQLLSAGGDPNAVDDNGWTPLHFACQTYAPSIVRELLAAGASPDPRDEHGNTPLWRAVFNSKGNGEIISILRSAGADPLAENRTGVSPVTLSRTIANFDVRQFFQDISA